MLEPMLKVALVIFLSSVMIVPAQAQSNQTAQYDVYAGGIHALQAKLKVNVKEKDLYDVSLAAKTYGLLGKMAPWEGNFTSNGWINKKFTPELHQSEAIWRGEKEVKKYQYTKEGSFISYSVKDKENNGSPQKVDEELTQGTSDVLSATLNIMNHIAKGGVCEGEEDIFDGRRRFKLIFKEQGTTQMEKSRWNVYAGPAIECTAEVKPVAGKWHEKPRGWMSIQEQGREKGTLPTVWFAKLSENEPAVPVKVRVKTSYGTLFMHMTQYQMGDNKVVLKQ